MNSSNYTISTSQSNGTYCAVIKFQSASKSNSNQKVKIVRSTSYELELAIKELLNTDYQLGHKFDRVTRNRFLLFAAIGIALVLIVAFLSQLFEYIINVQTEAGTLNSAAGIFNNIGTPVLALLSYLALLYTLLQQNRAHQVSLEELELTRKELVDSTEAQKQQAETLKHQLIETKETARLERFNSSFYALFAQHNAILDRLDKRKLFMHFKDCESDIGQQLIHLLNDKDHSRYFRVLYQILKLIAVEHSKKENFDPSVFNTPISNTEKFYSNLVRSMLPDEILYALAVNCHCPKGENDSFYPYKKLVIRYSFLEHIHISNGDWSMLWLFGSFGHNSLILTRYDLDAFGDNQHLYAIHSKITSLHSVLEARIKRGEDYAYIELEIKDSSLPNEDKLHLNRLIEFIHREINKKQFQIVKNCYMYRVITILTGMDASTLHKLKTQPLD